MTAVVLRGDARRLPLPPASVDLICCSPPYFGLRSYVDAGEHYDGQIGSEATPAEWLAALVACTREWVRVLKPQGSLFVNLGDSYCSQPAGKPGGNGQVNGKNPAEAPAARRGERNKRPTGGRQMTREDAAWLAGVIDSDGSVSIHINQQPEGRAPSFVAWVRVGQMRPEVVRRIGEITGTGQVMEDGRGVWNWCAAAQQARWVLSRIYPWLLIKRRQAAAAIEVARHVEERNARSTCRPLTQEDIAYRHRLRDAAMAWNKGRADDLTPPEPAPVPLPVYPLAPAAKSQFALPWQYALACVGELGLILRRDIIWSKPNGLPESVTDRCRSSHEYVFHLVKQPRYYAAVDEIREPHQPQSIARTGRRYNAGDQFSVSTPNTLDPAQFCNPLGKLPGSDWGVLAGDGPVWPIPSQPLTVPAHLGVDHFAAFPMELPRRIILGWSPPGICTACGEGRRPVPASVALDMSRPQARRAQQLADRAGLTEDHFAALLAVGVSDTGRGAATQNGTGKNTPQVYALADEARDALGGYAREYLLRRPTRFAYACACPQPDAPVRPALVVDPFGGTGTTALVASMYGRLGFSFDLSADYCRLARWRTADPAERAKALEVPKPPPVPDGQASLFDDMEAV